MRPQFLMGLFENTDTPLIYIMYSSVKCNHFELILVISAVFDGKIGVTTHFTGGYDDS